VKDLLRPALIICVALAVPILPFLVFGEEAEAWMTEWSRRPGSAMVTALVIVGLLAGDIFLPTPSSVISTIGGWQLGALVGTLVSWIGMTLGAMIGFWLARRWGRPLALWISDQRHLDRMHASSERYGPLILVIARGVPVFAEASVLLMGIHQLAWRRFLIPVVLSNLGIALAYSAFGDFAEKYQWLPLAMGVSIALPVVLTIMVLRWLPRDGESIMPPAVEGRDEE